MLNHMKARDPPLRRKAGVAPKGRVCTRRSETWVSNRTLLGKMSSGLEIIFPCISISFHLNASFPLAFILGKMRFAPEMKSL